MVNKTHNRQRLSEFQAQTALDHSLDTLKVLTEAFDSGRYGVAFSMANEIVKIVSGNEFCTKHRGAKNFKVPNLPILENNLAPQTRIILTRIHNMEEQYGMFLPLFLPENLPTTVLKFREWWNRDPIYISKPNIKTGERKNLTRRQFITDVRNTRGSHFDLNEHEEIELLQSVESVGVYFIAERPDGNDLSTEDGSLEIRISPAAAMMRQISFELLNAYGIKDDGMQY
ncbi:hypothetical protein [Asticcacaulis solisilvae]|uniref:hypothetical protein n=1 Tax=Asticcacaulis solisilvae TaxID=1217274 RepID=UPI003FD6F5AD